MTDNIKKVFDLLGVEPNEKFKIRDIEGIYYIDVDLWLRNEEKEIFSNVFVVILRDPLMIIKLPKKKKLKDLTPEEFDKWKKKNCNENIDCEKCIFYNVNCEYYAKIVCWLYHKDLYSDKFLDQEVEIED